MEGNSHKTRTVCGTAPAPLVLVSAWRVPRCTLPIYRHPPSAALLVTLASLSRPYYCCIAKMNEAPYIRTMANGNDDSHKHLAKAPPPSNIAAVPGKASPSSSCARRLMCYHESCQAPLEPVLLSASASLYKPVVKEALSAMLARVPSSGLIPFPRATLAKPC